MNYMPTVTLTNSSDVYSALAGDVVYALDGNDTIDFLGSNPPGSGYSVYGGNGADRLTGSNVGDDYLSGDAGDDILTGNIGNDSLVGGLGSDFMSGGSGGDSLFSHDVSTSDSVVERDEMYGGSGRNSFILRTDYLGGAQSTLPGTDSSHARILDWSSGDASGAGNTIDLKYAPSSYSISTTGNFIGGAANDTRITYNNGGVNNLVVVIADAAVSTSQLV